MRSKFNKNNMVKNKSGKMIVKKSLFAKYNNKIKCYHN